MRAHLKAIQRHSVHRVALMPDDALSRWATRKRRWHELTRAVCSLPLDCFRLVHSHVSPNFIAACRRAQAAGVPWIHTYHTLYFPEHSTSGRLEPWQEDINRALIREARHADVRISISPWLQALLLEKYGIETLLVPNGVDVDECLAAQKTTKSSRSRQLGDFVLYSGNLSEVKNPALFIDLAARVPGMTFVMIGKGLEGEALSEVYGQQLPENLLPFGPVDHNEALRLTEGARSLVVTSHSEGLPTAVLEAMALAKPVVAPDSFGCRDLIQHGINGFLYSPGVLDAVAEQLQIALEAVSVGATAARIVQREYAWPQVIQKIDAIYSERIA